MTLNGKIHQPTANLCVNIEINVYSTLVLNAILNQQLNNTSGDGDAIDFFERVFVCGVNPCDFHFYEIYLAFPKWSDTCDTDRLKKLGLQQLKCCSHGCFYTDCYHFFGVRRWYKVTGKTGTGCFYTDFYHVFGVRRRYKVRGEPGAKSVHKLLTIFPLSSSSTTFHQS